MMTTLLAEIEQLGQARVLCVGDVMLDRFVYGSTQRISPEAPVPVVRVTYSQAMPGGAGNVARNVVALGAHCSLLTVTGNDMAGEELKVLFEKLPRLTCTAAIDETRPTTVKTRFVSSGQQVLRVDQEVDSPISADVAQQLVGQATKLLREVDVVILSDYAKGVLTPQVTSAVIAAARALQIPVIVDPKGRDYRKYDGASLLTPNVRELQEFTGVYARTDDGLEGATNTLLSLVNIDAVLVTNSERGMSYVRRDCSAVHIPATAHEVFDVSGAGDTVVATVAVAMGIGIDNTRAARLANLAGGIVVGKVGTAAVGQRELLEAMRREERGLLLEKLSEPEDAIALAQRWRDEGHRIGFTNGCFDLIHPGHISLLTQAAGQCDRLIVGLNSDVSVRRLKGSERPIQSELARALVLAALRGVDAVVLFDEDTPEPLIRKLRPDVLVKGADYAASQVVGAEFVQSYGGTLFLAELAPNQSTTRIVNRFNRSPPDGVNSSNDES
ncbi:MAG: D-beta-D-heptose 7-phosphate kinase / D-beta-D-heptose 1-phosphate adenosyltransferase [Micromonosporaceae bacterium]|nr:D-beta-D-heptose 7-phosphate kinase / D-beta-D-heptose 1-phosphate adenosyltransferase [Micromonosporaceae bacterium]